MKNKNIKRAEDLFDKYALLYQEKYMSVEKYHDSLDTFLNALSAKDATILELACGPGNITKYLLAQNPELQILATDLSPSMVKLAKENNPQISVQIMDCRSLLDLESTFQAIVCGFGLPYLSKEESIQLIKDASQSLMSHGLLYLSTMEDDYSKSGFKPSSTDPNEGLIMYFHEAKYLTEAMKKNGFEIVELSRVNYLDNIGEDVTDLIIIGKLIS